LRKKYIFIFIAFFVSIVSVFGQSDRGVIRNLQAVDRERIHFGFILGLNYSDYTVAPSNTVTSEGNVLYAASEGLSPGFTVGMIVDLRLFEYMNLRFMPTLDLGQRNISFVELLPNTQVRIDDPTIINVKSTSVNLPFYIKYSAKRVGNYRPYLIAGGGPSINLARSKVDPILVEPFDIQLSFGVGCDFYLQYFKLCPEIKFGFGFFDMLDRDHPEIMGTVDQKYTDAISKLSPRLVTVTFNFE